MSRVANIVRILFIGLRYRLDTVFLEFLGDHPLRWLLPGQYLPLPKRSSAERLRDGLIRLGPIYVKMGQALSTRRDLLSDDYADELAKLQDRVPPFDSKVAVELIEHALDSSIDELFRAFDHKPIASASLAQVHGAELWDGTKIVVKVIRPDVERSIERDLNLVLGISIFLERASRLARRLHLTELVEEYRVTITNELDLEQEAVNTNTLRLNFAGSPLLYAPRVFRELTTQNILVMERIEGVPISAVEDLKQMGTDLKLLAERGVETFFTQVFTHNFFHADMHPGNIFVDVSDPRDPSYIAIDCAIIGQLSDADRTFVARNIYAFFNRNYAEIARLHLESGWIPSNANIAEFEQIIEELCEPLFLKPLAEISFGKFLLNLFKAARQFEMEVQPQLVLLQKTLLNIEGLGRTLDPDLDLWATAKPFIENWMKEQFGVIATVSKFIERAPEIALELPMLPDVLVTARRSLTRIERDLAVQRDSIEELQTTTKRSRGHRSFFRLVGFGLTIAGAAFLWPLLGASEQTMDLTRVILSTVGIGVGLTLLVRG